MSKDDYGAYVPGTFCGVAPLAGGALDGLRFAVKDLIDVAGYVTGGGNPDWARGRAPAARHAPAVRQLLAAGASVHGKTISDELAFSLEGENWHYGTPRNPRCPDSLPGGSSSGSAVAVAAGLADFALGTDTGGSVRVPAAFCGVYGMRPSHGRLPLHGVLPFAPGYDTIGWFARSADMLARVGAVLLGDDAIAVAGAPRLLLLEDVFAMCEPALDAHLRQVAQALVPAASLTIFDGHPQDWLQSYQVLQGAQIKQSLGDWLMRARPQFGPAIAPRFDSVLALHDEQALEQLAHRTAMRRILKQLLQPGVVLVLPTTPTTALALNASAESRNAFYAAVLAINAIAGHAGLPQLTIPAGEVNGKPAGLSFITMRGADRWLLHHAQQWSAVIDHQHLETA
ncbi:amidase [Duganella sp. PWIR1]